MPKFSAGLLPYRKNRDVIEVFLVHPGGPFWAKKDLGAWSLAKGEYLENEDPKTAAKREFQEETGHAAPNNKWLALGEAKYGNKVVTAWAVEAELNEKNTKSNTFTMEWPPRSGQQQEFPEVDKADWFDLSTAKQKLVKGQMVFIERLAHELGNDLPVEPTQPSLF
jgi:predicted NUDIX family NTP pyrophosphohydrolase